MLKFLIASFASAVLVAACSAPEAAGSAEISGIEASTPVQATRLLTENSPASEGAAGAASDSVPRDADGRPYGYALLGRKLPAFTAPMADGGTFESGAINRWTVFAVWGAWCTESVADGPYVDALSRAIAQDPDLDFVTLHVPQTAARATPEEMFGKHGSLAAYFESAGYTLPVVLDTDGSLREALRISWTPTYLVVSPDGIVRGFRTDLSVDQDQPVKSFIRDIARVRGEVGAAASLVMSPAGVAGLGQHTPFTVSAVEKAFPGYTVIPITDPATGIATFEVRPSGSDTARFLIEPDWTRGYVAAVRSRDPGVRGPAGEVIGQATFADLPLDQRGLCGDAVTVEGGREFSCPDPAAPGAFARVYRFTPSSSSVETLIPDLEAAKLVELRYVASAP